MACDDISVTSGRVGARVLTRFGRPLTKCCSCNDVLGNSVIESQFSPLSLFCEPTELFREFCVSNKSGMCPTLSTTDCGRTLCANERRLGWKYGVAYFNDIKFISIWNLFDLIAKFGGIKSIFGCGTN